MKIETSASWNYPELRGDPRVYLLEDSALPCGWLLLAGWEAINLDGSAVLVGTVFRRGKVRPSAWTPSGRRDARLWDEDGAECGVSHGHMYVELPSRTWARAAVSIHLEVNDEDDEDDADSCDPSERFGAPARESAS